MPDRIETGDVVVLKSGGPKMYVELALLDRTFPKADCIWFNSLGNVRRETFYINTLKKA